MLKCPLNWKKEPNQKLAQLYKLSVTELAEMKKQIERSLSERLHSTKCQPRGRSCLIRKEKDGSLRMCIDYRALNKQTIRNQVPLPRIDEVWDQLSGAKYFPQLT